MKVVFYCTIKDHTYQVVMMILVHMGETELALAIELATNRKIKLNNPPHNSF